MRTFAVLASFAALALLGVVPLVPSAAADCVVSAPSPCGGSCTVSVAGTCAPGGTCIINVAAYCSASCDVNAVQVISPGGTCTGNGACLVSVQSDCKGTCVVNVGVSDCDNDCVLNAALADCDGTCTINVGLASCPGYDCLVNAGPIPVTCPLTPPPAVRAAAPVHAAPAGGAAGAIRVAVPLAGPASLP
jgi:hypothetical protein